MLHSRPPPPAPGKKAMSYQVDPCKLCLRMLGDKNHNGRMHDACAVQVYGALLDQAENFLLLNVEIHEKGYPVTIDTMVKQAKDLIAAIQMQRRG